MNHTTSSGCDKMTQEEIAAELREWGRVLKTGAIQKRFEELAQAVEKLKDVIDECSLHP